MTTIFYANNPNFPKNQAELDSRLYGVEQLVNAPNANIPFVKTAFKLMEDCDLLTEENINFLINPHALKAFDQDFRFMRNPKEGALRQVTNFFDVLDDNDLPRFYNGGKMPVSTGQRTFLISNDWYKDDSPCPNKHAFFYWLKLKAQAACDKFWTEQVISDGVIDEAPASLEDLQKKIDKLNSDVKMLNDKFDMLLEFVKQFSMGVINLNELPAHMAEFEVMNKKIDNLTEQVENLYKVWQ